jgi:flagellar protein FlgJ
MDSGPFSPLAQRALPAETDVGAQPAPAAAPADAAYRAKASEAAVKFESFFIGQMLHKMRESARSVGDHDQQEDSVNSDMLDMADNLVADQLAGRHAFGIADAILRQLLPAAPAATAAAATTEKKTPPA